MLKRYDFILLGILGMMALFAAGCATKSVGSINSETPVTNQGYKTAIHKQLRNLPDPAGKIYTSVYSFEDQTGQYREGEGGSTNFSSAVTQGSAAILIDALEKTSWFSPLERDGLQHLLQERKLIRQKNNGKIPALKHSAILLEGGVIGYEKNTITGGIGVKYFNVGPDVQIRHDQVTVYLRAVDVRSGEVLKSVSATKSILSKKVQFSLFRFVRPQRLLEIETGISHNPPRMMCVMEAIEKCVFDLIVAGVQDDLWRLEHPSQLKKLKELAEAEYANGGIKKIKEDGEVVFEKNNS
jgi:curli production assembly/transport component CsgG